MRATTTLKVPPELEITVTLVMRVDEMDSLLEATKDVTRWPMGSFRNALSQSLGTARAAYSSQHFIE